MNDIQKFYFDRMIAALYEAQAELMANIKSKDSQSYFGFSEKVNLPTEIFDSFKELEAFLNNSDNQLQSKVDVTLDYTSLHALNHSGFSLFNITSK
jgi:hypothetical protein